MVAPPYIGEIRLVAFNFEPRGWAICDGRLLPINGNEALFSILGTTYGGDGRSNFALPDLRGRVPLHVGANGPYLLGQSGGEDNHTLTVAEMPGHSLPSNFTADPTSQLMPEGQVWVANRLNRYPNASPDAAMSDSAITGQGGGQPHENRPPYLVLNYIIALQGEFPPHS